MDSKGPRFAGVSTSSCTGNEPRRQGLEGILKDDLAEVSVSATRRFRVDGRSPYPDAPGQANHPVAEVHLVYI